MPINYKIPLKVSSDLMTMQLYIPFPSLLAAGDDYGTKFQATGCEKCEMTGHALKRKQFASFVPCLSPFQLTEMQMW